MDDAPHMSAGLQLERFGLVLHAFVRGTCHSPLAV
jgi:hypothetical protein